MRYSLPLFGDEQRVTKHENTDVAANLGVSHFFL